MYIKESIFKKFGGSDEKIEQGNRSISYRSVNEGVQSAVETMPNDVNSNAIIKNFFWQNDKEINQNDSVEDISRDFNLIIREGSVMLDKNRNIQFSIECEEAYFKRIGEILHELLLYRGSTEALDNYAQNQADEPYKIANYDIGGFLEQTAGMRLFRTSVVSRVDDASDHVEIKLAYSVNEPG